MQNNTELQNNLIVSWVTLSRILKNNRITKELKYNEAIIMLSVYNRYLADGEGLTPVKDIIKETGMLKSLVNRTISILEKKGLVVCCAGEHDRRTKYVKCIKEKLDVFLRVHNTSLQLAQNIIDLIGQNDAQTFVRIVDKIASSQK